MSTPALFTPNVVPDDPSVRYRLYRHGPCEFSATPGGPRFKAFVAPAPCGLGCYCAASITPVTEEDAAILRTAETF